MFLRNFTILFWNWWKVTIVGTLSFTKAFLYSFKEVKVELTYILLLPKKHRLPKVIH